MNAHLYDSDDDRHGYYATRYCVDKKFHVCIESGELRAITVEKCDGSCHKVRDLPAEATALVQLFVTRGMPSKLVSEYGGEPYIPVCTDSEVVKVRSPQYYAERRQRKLVAKSRGR